LYVSKLSRSCQRFYCRFGFSSLAGNVLQICDFSTTVQLKNRTSIIRKNCQPKHRTPAFAKPMLADGVLSSVSRSCVQFSNTQTCQSACLAWLVRGQKIKNTEGWERKKKILLGEEKSTLFLQLCPVRLLVAAAKCVCFSCGCIIRFLLNTFSIPCLCRNHILSSQHLLNEKISPKTVLHFQFVVL
jgi:hypothetical protein